MTTNSTCRNNWLQQKSQNACHYANLPSIL